MSVNAKTQDLLDEGRFSKIKGWMHFKRVYEMAVERVCRGDKAHFVEIGAWKGKSSFYMGALIAGSGKDIKFDVIDNWLGDASSLNKQQTDPDVLAGTLIDTFKKNTELVKDSINEIISGDSSLQADRYEDESLDFVWIDGDHTYEGCLKDIEAFYPKVKVGGVIGGDDYSKKSVRQAVHEKFESVQTFCESKVPVWRIVKGKKPYDN